MFAFELNDWIWGADRNPNSRQQVARIISQAGSYAGRPYAFQKAPTRGEKKQRRKAHSFCSSMPLSLSPHGTQSSEPVIPLKSPPQPAPEPAPLCHGRTPPPSSTAPPQAHGSLAFLYLQIRHVPVALLRAGVVRQLHIPETGELIHEEGVLFDDGVENILGEKSQTQSKWSGGFHLRCQLSRP